MKLFNNCTIERAYVCLHDAYKIMCQENYN